MKDKFDQIKLEQFFFVEATKAENEGEHYYYYYYNVKTRMKDMLNNERLC